MTKRSCLAGKSRLLTGCRNSDQAIRPIRERAIGLMCTVFTPAVGVLLHRGLTLAHEPRAPLDTCDLANTKRRADERSDVSGVTNVVVEV